MDISLELSPQSSTRSRPISRCHRLCLAINYDYVLRVIAHIMPFIILGDFWLYLFILKYSLFNPDKNPLVLAKDVELIDLCYNIIVNFIYCTSAVSFVWFFIYRLYPKYMKNKKTKPGEMEFNEMDLADANNNAGENLNENLNIDPNPNVIEVQVVDSVV